MSWRDEAACRGMDPEPWFPSSANGRSNSTKDAKAICHSCPVEQECLDYALDNHIRFGVWGGLGYRERMRFAKTRNNKGKPRVMIEACRKLDDMPPPTSRSRTGGPKATATYDTLCGTYSGYARGCRGDACYQAERDRYKRWYEANKERKNAADRRRRLEVKDQELLREAA